MKNITLSGFLLTLLSLNTLACSCLQLSLEEHFKSSKNVYFGQLVSAQYLKANTDREWPSIKGIITISDTFKGEKKNQVNILTGIGGGDCGIPLTVGKHYAIFIEKEGEYIGSCGGSQQIDFINKAVFLDKLNSFAMEKRTKVK